MNHLPLVYVVILNYNGAQLTINCLDSVLKSAYTNLRVVVVDNGSSDDSLARLELARTDSRVEILPNDTNEGYAGGNNRGIERALSEGADYVLVLNNDTIADPECAGSLVRAFEANPRIAIAGCEIENIGYKPGRNQGQKLSLFTGKTRHWRHEASTGEPVDVDFICGAAIMLRAETLREIGMFDSHFFLYFEDADICFRARAAGYRVCFVPGPRVRHLMSATARAPRNAPLVSFCLRRNRIWFIRRHGHLRHRFVLAVLTFCYQYPKTLLADIARGKFSFLVCFLRAVWSGYCADVRRPDPIRISSVRNCPQPSPVQYSSDGGVKSQASPTL